MDSKTQYMAFIIILEILFYGIVNVIAVQEPMTTDTTKTATLAADALLVGISQGLQPIALAAAQSADQSSQSVSQPNIQETPSTSLDETSFGMPGSVSANAAAILQQQTFGEKAVENSEALLGLEYGYGGKGFDYQSMVLASAEDIKDGYTWYNADTDALETSSKIDCSGLVAWAFNTAAEAENLEATFDEKNEYAASLWAKTQIGYSANVNDKSDYIHSSPPDASDLNIGDLLFLDGPDKKAGVIDHVAIYAGNGEVIESSLKTGVHRITYDQWLSTPLNGQTYSAYFAGYGRVAGAENPVSTSNLGGINFTSIKLNYISVSTDQEGGINFDIVLKAEKAKGANPSIDIINSTRIGATAFMTGLTVPSNKFWVNLGRWCQWRSKSVQ